MNCGPQSLFPSNFDLWTIIPLQYGLHVDFSWRLRRSVKKSVNFINILRADFAPIFFRQKLQCQTVIREKLRKTLFYQKFERKMFMILTSGSPRYSREKKTADNEGVLFWQKVFIWDKMYVNPWTGKLTIRALRSVRIVSL